MPLRIGNVAIDCDDVQKVARFWSAAIGRPLDGFSDAGFASIGIHDVDRGDPAWLFEKVPEPKTAKNRVHLDFVDPDVAFVERLLSLGASVVAEHDVPGTGHGWTVMQDPEGNEFCVSRTVYSG